MKSNRKAYPCPACQGEGAIMTASTLPGHLTKVTWKECDMCEGYKCVWIEPISSNQQEDIPFIRET